MNLRNTLLCAALALATGAQAHEGKAHKGGIASAPSKGVRADSSRSPRIAASEPTRTVKAKRMSPGVMRFLLIGPPPEPLETGDHASPVRVPSGPLSRVNASEALTPGRSRPDDH